MEITYANPGYFYLLILVAISVLIYIIKLNKMIPTVQLSQTKAFAIKKVQGSRNYFRHVPFIFRCLAMVAIIFVLARPQIFNRTEDSTIEGIDIMLSMDLSESMKAIDVNPNRIEAAKKVGIDFVAGRKNDQIGLVVFEGAAFTQCPLTIDHTQVINMLNGLQAGTMDETGTAIGMGLISALNRIKDSKAKSRVIILLTDGVNNSGSVSPATAAEMAKGLGVKIYTVGLGTKGEAKIPIQTALGVKYATFKADVDDVGLTKIAEITGGQYFRATDAESLKNIYNTIDKLEKSKINVVEHRQASEVFFWFAIAAIICIILEVLVRVVIIRQIP